MKFTDVLKAESAPKKVFTISEELELYKAGLLDEGKKLKEEEDEKAEEKCEECGAVIKDGEDHKCKEIEEGCKSKKSKNESEDEDDEESGDDEKDTEEKDDEPKDEGKKSKKDMKESEEINEGVDVAKVIKSLGDTDWGKDNDAQMKAVQLLKGIALSDDPKSNAFMKALSDASTGIAKKVLEYKEETKEKPVSESASYAAELMDGPELAPPTQASTELTNYANDLM